MESLRLIEGVIADSGVFASPGVSAGELAGGVLIEEVVGPLAAASPQDI